MSNKLVKAIDKTGKLRLVVVNSTNIVKVAKAQNDTKNSATQILGQTLTASILLAASFLKDNDEMTVRLLGNGLVGSVICTAKADLKVKGYIKHPHAIDSSSEALVGKGILEITKDQGLQVPYTGQVPIVSEKISENFVYYLAKSEQINSAMGLSVLTSSNGDVNAAGGFLLQALPGASNKQVKDIETKISSLGKLSDYFLNSNSLNDLINKILGNEFKILEEDDASFFCDCSKEKYARILGTLNRKTLTEMIKQDHGAELKCNFCAKKYKFSEQELIKIRN